MNGEYVSQNKKVVERLVEYFLLFIAAIREKNTKIMKKMCRASSGVGFLKPSCRYFEASLPAKSLKTKHYAIKN
jgi:hypothetical protein